MVNETENTIEEVEAFGGLLTICNWLMLPLGCILINIHPDNDIFIIGIKAIGYYLGIMLFLHYIGNLIISILYLPVILITSFLQTNNKKNNICTLNIVHSIFFTAWAMLTLFFLEGAFPKIDIGQLILWYPLMTLPFVNYSANNQDLGDLMYIYVFCLELASIIFIIITFFAGIQDMHIFILFAFIIWALIQHYTKGYINEK